MYRIVNRKKLLAVRAADTLGRVLAAPFRLLAHPGPVDPATVESILVIRTAYIGDVVMATPMLGPLRRRFPLARLSFLTAGSSVPVLEGNPHVDEIIRYDPFWFYPRPKRDYLSCIRELRKRRFDLVIEARGDIRDIALLAAPLRARYRVGYAVGGGGWLLSHVVPHPAVNHRVEYHLDIARFLGATVEASPGAWGLFLTPEEHREGAWMLGEAGVSGGYFCLHPGSRVPLKRWESGRYAALADAVAARHGLTPVLLGGPDETELAASVAGAMRTRAVDLSGRLSLRRMGAVLAGCSIFICNDSAPMHIAAGLGVPTVALFGPSKSDQTGPWSPRARVVEKPFPCRAACDETTCRFSRHNACMADIAVEDVLAAANDLPAQA